MTRTYAAYDDTAIYGTGSTADAALADAQQYGATRGLSTAPMTKYFASYIEKNGFNGKTDEFGKINGTVVSGRAYWRLSGQRNR